MPSILRQIRIINGVVIIFLSPGIATGVCGWLLLKGFGCFILRLDLKERLTDTGANANAWIQHLIAFRFGIALPNTDPALLIQKIISPVPVAWASFGLVAHSGFVVNSSGLAPRNC